MIIQCYGIGRVHPAATRQPAAATRTITTMGAWSRRIVRVEKLQDCKIGVGGCANHPLSARLFK